MRATKNLVGRGGGRINDQVFCLRLTVADRRMSIFLQTKPNVAINNFIYLLMNDQF